MRKRHFYLGLTCTLIFMMCVLEINLAISFVRFMIVPSASAGMPWWLSGLTFFGFVITLAMGFALIASVVEPLIWVRVRRRG